MPERDAVSAWPPAGIDAPATVTGTDALDTPVVLVDLDRVDANIARFQAYLDRHGLHHRPHVKTHKLPFLAHAQLRAGAVGITVQKLGEAEAMVAAGVRDVLVTYDLIGPNAATRLARLAGLATISVAADNEVALATVAEAAALGGSPIGLLVEFESGKERQGVLRPEEAIALARRADAARNVNFLGLLTYPATERTAAWIADARERFHAEGMTIEVVSGGGTPNMWRAHEIDGLTEYRAGTYVYHDRSTVAAGAARLENCALHVLATVVSMPTRDRAVIDAGSKTLTSDPWRGGDGQGHGLILEYPQAVLHTLSEEHGVVDFSQSPRRPAIGERVRVLPNHACPVSNLVDEVYALRRGELVAALPVTARGRSR